MKLDPTRAGAAKFGFEEIEASGDTAFHEIVTDIFRIGRDRDGNLVIRGDTKTSRRHASVQRKGLKFFIQDEGSSNGTKVNGDKIEGSYELKPGDTVVIGSHTFKFVKRT
ncbi:MAG: FHA domain-containing protein [Planctomycetes bacterium]|nr:FHA domain-containing protein [Planctomycetota bacterium]